MNRKSFFTTLAVGLLTFVFFSLRGAGSDGAEEAAIRKIIAAHDQKGGDGREGYHNRQTVSYGPVRKSGRWWATKSGSC